jgi:hypothetical protein
MPITHSFISQKPDGQDTSVVRPSDWNAEHVIDGIVGGKGEKGDTGPAGPTLMTVSFSDTLTLTNSPANEREILGLTSYRLKLDLANFTYFRAVLNVQTKGATNADVHFEGGTDGTNFADMGADGGPEIAIGATGAQDTGWVSLRASLRANSVFIRMQEKDGDGTADPVVRQILLMFK